MVVSITENGIYKLVAGTSAEVLGGLVSLHNPKAVAMAIDSTNKVYILTQA